MATCYSVSRFSHIFCREEVAAIYQPLTLQVVYTDTNLGRIIGDHKGRQIDISLNSQDVDSLVNAGVLTENENQDQTLLDQLRNKYLGKPETRCLVLVLTDACNLACHYCFFMGNFPTNRTYNYMDPELAILAVDKFSQLLAQAIQQDPEARKDSEIILYGGEPFLNQPALFAAFDKISEYKSGGLLPQETTISLITNGTLINENIAQRLAKYSIDVNVSLDGPEEINDPMRVDHNSQGTFLLIDRGIKLLLEHGIDVGISCTVTPHSVDNIVDLVTWFQQRYGIRNIGFNILTDTNTFRVDDQEYYSKVASQLIKAFVRARELGIAESRMLKKITAFVLGRYHIHDCSGCGDQMVVLPDGFVGPCHAYSGERKYFPVHIDDFTPDHETWVEWSRRSPIGMDQCLQCPALTFCGGGCPNCADKRHCSIWEVDDTFCPHALQTLEWLIWELYDNETN